MKRRNFAAKSPLLRKGGVHEKSRSTERAATKKAIRKQLRSWKALPSEGFDFLAVSAQPANTSRACKSA